MQIRCPKCQAAIWLDTDRRTSGRCSTCQQQYDFGDRLRGHRLGEIHRRARALAVERGIDLPSAFSLLLGITTLSDVHDFAGGAPTARPAARGTPGEPAASFDPAFQPAVDARTLSPLQATERGDRESYARRLIARHQLTLADAYAVADNRMSLLTAKRKRAAGTAIHLEAARPKRVGRLAAVATLALFGLVAFGIARQGDREATPASHASLVAGVALAASSQASHAPDARPTPIAPAEVVLDENGQPTRISASRPETVLRAFCDRPDRQAFGLSSGILPDPNQWLGLYRDLEDLTVYRAIAIRRDDATGRWTTGQAGSPIAVLTPAVDKLGPLHEIAAE